MSEYKRLTNKDWKENYDIFEDVCCDTCAEDCGECERNFNALVRLADLEDKIENGMLIELPCKVGDTVYFTDRNNENLTVENDILKSEKENAVKEFAEKVKKYSYTDNCFTDGKWHRYVLVSDIDEIIKEYEK